MLEESIKELETEEEEKRRREEAEAAIQSQADMDDIGEDSNDAADICPDIAVRFRSVVAKLNAEYSAWHNKAHSNTRCRWTD